MSDFYKALYWEKQRYLKDNKDMLIGGVLAILGAYFLLSRPDFPSGKYPFTWSILLSVYGIAFYFGCSLVAGWKLMDRFTSRFFLFLPIIGWIIYIFIKFGLALMVGGGYFYSIYRVVNNLIRINKINKQLYSASKND